MLKRGDQLYIELQQKAERLGYFSPLQLGRKRGREPFSSSLLLFSV